MLHLFFLYLDPRFVNRLDGVRYRYFSGAKAGAVVAQFDPDGLSTWISCMFAFAGATSNDWCTFIVIPNRMKEQVH